MKDPQVAKAISDVERTGSGRQTADKTSGTEPLVRA